jgi:hypothetical protein
LRRQRRGRVLSEHWKRLLKGLVLETATTSARRPAWRRVCFSAAIGVNLTRDRIFDCGCGGRTVPQLISWRHVAGNVVLVALAAGVAIAPPAGLELLPGSRGVFSAELPAGSGIPLLLATVLCLLTARMLAAALAIRSR